MIWLSPLSFPPALALGAMFAVFGLLIMLYKQHVIGRNLTRTLLAMALVGAGYDLAALITYSSFTMELSRYWYLAQQVFLSIFIALYLVAVNNLTGGLPLWLQIFGFSLPATMIVALTFYPSSIILPEVGKATIILGVWKRLEPQPGLLAEFLYGCTIFLLLFCTIYLMKSWQERDLRRRILLYGQLIFLTTALLDAATVVFKLPIPYIVEFGLLIILVTLLFVVSGDLLTEYRKTAHFNLMRARIMDNVSHELRTPIGVVRGYLEMLGQGRFGDLSDVQKDVVNKARSSADRQIEQVDDLLLAAMIERHGVVPKNDTVDIPQLVTKLSQDFEKRFSHTKTTISIFIEQYYKVQGDKYLLGKMIQKLLANAFIFGGEEGKIFVSLFVNENEAGLTIDDHGQGIPEDLLSDITAPFTNVPGQQIPKGIGLGLTLSAEIVHLHGGRLELSNRPTGGLHVEVSLPLLQNAASDQGAVAS